MSPMRHWRPALLALLLAPLAPAANAPAPGNAGKEPLEEVVVSAATLKDLQLQIDRLEDAFYERFNALNEVREFDTFCHQEARVGTLIKRRYCRAVYVDKALEQEAQDYTIFLQRSTSGGAGGKSAPVFGGPPPPALAAMEARRDAYRQNLRDVVAKHPELLQILEERSKLGERYEALHRKTFGEKAP